MRARNQWKGTNVQSDLEYAKTIIAQLAEVYNGLAELQVGLSYNSELEARTYCAAEFAFAANTKLRAIVDDMVKPAYAPDGREGEHITDDERNQIAAYAKHIDLGGLERFSDLQLYTYFSMHIDDIIQTEEKATNTTLDDHVSISHLMYDIIAWSVDSNAVEDGEWITKYTNAGAFASIIRETALRTSES